MLPNKFQMVYPFTTEVISGYINDLDLKDKSLLTVGSSLDQAFSAMVCGASKITVYDICKNTKEFYKLKRNLILRNKRENLYKAVVNNDKMPYMNDCYLKDLLKNMLPYLGDDYLYRQLQEKLENPNIEFITGNIYEMDKRIPYKKFDRMIFSNVLQYIDDYYHGNYPYKFLDNKIKEWFSHLNYNGIIQLLYCYDYNMISDEDKERLDYFIDNYLSKYNYEIHTFSDCVDINNDAVVYVKKGK